MDEKRLKKIIGYVDVGWNIPNEPAKLLVAEIRRLREALARIRAVWEDVHDETSIVGIIDNALGLEPAPETEE